MKDSTKYKGLAALVSHMQLFPWQTDEERYIGN